MTQWARNNAWRKSKTAHVRKHYARILPVFGAGVDRRTRSCLTSDDLALAVKREIKARREAGPYLVHWYEDGQQVRVTQEG